MQQACGHRHPPTIPRSPDRIDNGLAVTASDAPPNVVLILADDMGCSS